MTALAFREFARPGERAWTEYLEHIADVAGRSQRALVLVAVIGDDRILGSTTLELEGRIDEDDAPLGRGEAHVRERMTIAQRMYESMGFVRGTDRTFPDGFSLLTFAKEL